MFLAWLILQRFYRGTGNSGMVLAQGGACPAIIQSRRYLCGRACSDQCVSKGEPRYQTQPRPLARASCSHSCLILTEAGSRELALPALFQTRWGHSARLPGHLWVALSLPNNEFACSDHDAETVSPCAVVQACYNDAPTNTSRGRRSLRLFQALCT